MRIVIILLLIVGIVFAVAILALGPERDDSGEGVELPAWLAFLKRDSMMQRALTPAVEIAGAGSKRVFTACKVPSRLVTAELLEGPGVRVAFRCGQTADVDCRSPSELCEDTTVACVVAAEGITGLGCDSDRTYVGKVDFSVGPEGGDFSVAPIQQNAATKVRLR
jgi:hypothetical protein